MNIRDAGSLQTSRIAVTASSGQPGQITVEDNVSSTLPPVREDAYIPLNRTTQSAYGEDAAASLDVEQKNTARSDQYIPSTSIISDALYNVSDIKRDEKGNIIRNLISDPSSYHGRRVIDKIADIPLPMGRKNLSIFKLND